MSAQSVKRALLDAETQARLLDPEAEAEAEAEADRDRGELVRVKRERLAFDDSPRRTTVGPPSAVESRALESASSASSSPVRHSTCFRVSCCLLLARNLHAAALFLAPRL